MNGKSFTILKLRTMEVGAEDKQEELRRKTLDERGGAIMFKLEDDPRVTSFGKKLRRWSLDELPQLWNVLRGDMSIVGPRPVLFEETDLVSDRYSARAVDEAGYLRSLAIARAKRYPLRGHGPSGLHLRGRLVALGGSPSDAEDGR